MYNPSENFYRNYPVTEEEKADILRFLKLEREIDEQNELEFQRIDKSHINKTNMKKIESGFKANAKTSSKSIKDYTYARTSRYGTPRTWYQNEA